MRKDYRVIAVDEAKARELPGHDKLPRRGYGWALYVCTDGQPTRLVYCDAAEPEDQILVRHQAVLVDELNKVAGLLNECVEALVMAKALIEGARDAVP